MSNPQQINDLFPSTAHKTIVPTSRTSPTLDPTRSPPLLFALVAAGSEFEVEDVSEFELLLMDVLESSAGAVDVAVADPELVEPAELVLEPGEPREPEPAVCTETDPPSAMLICSGKLSPAQRSVKAVCGVNTLSKNPERMSISLSTTSRISWRARPGGDRLPVPDEQIKQSKKSCPNWGTCLRKVNFFKHESRDLAERYKMLTLQRQWFYRLKSTLNVTLPAASDKDVVKAWTGLAN
ncbi:hypothetical protein C8R43DRAFT_951947 [Mycena crocata]|nr:hypothetical protein C8R43DRAFT_951947 [Mycena crocata]